MYPCALSLRERRDATRPSAVAPTHSPLQTCSASSPFLLTNLKETHIRLKIASNILTVFIFSFKNKEGNNVVPVRVGALQVNLTPLH
jgi:hypothetical protein